MLARRHEHQPARGQGITLGGAMPGHDAKLPAARGVDPHAEAAPQRVGQKRVARDGLRDVAVVAARDDDCCRQVEVKLQPPQHLDVAAPGRQGQLLAPGPRQHDPDGSGSAELRLEVGRGPRELGADVVDGAARLGQERIACHIGVIADQRVDIAQRLDDALRPLPERQLVVSTETGPQFLDGAVDGLEALASLRLAEPATLAVVLNVLAHVGVEKAKVGALVSGLVRKAAGQPRFEVGVPQKRSEVEQAPVGKPLTGRLEQAVGSRPRQIPPRGPVQGHAGRPAGPGHEVLHGLVAEADRDLLRGIGAPEIGKRSQDGLRLVARPVGDHDPVLLDVERHVGPGLGPQAPQLVETILQRIGCVDEGVDMVAPRLDRRPLHPVELDHTDKHEVAVGAGEVAAFERFPPRLVRVEQAGLGQLRAVRAMNRLERAPAVGLAEELQTLGLLGDVRRRDALTGKLLGDPRNRRRQVVPVQDVLNIGPRGHQRRDRLLVGRAQRLQPGQHLLVGGGRGPALQGNRGVNQAPRREDGGWDQGQALGLAALGEERQQQPSRPLAGHDARDLPKVAGRVRASRAVSGGLGQPLRGGGKRRFGPVKPHSLSHAHGSLRGVQATVAGPWGQGPLPARGPARSGPDPGRIWVANCCESGILDR
ncbi:MAG: hypothetical protein ACYTAQ_14365 [Planctomycetota bacterium]